MILYDNKYKSNIFLLNVNQKILVGTIIIIKTIIFQEFSNNLDYIIKEYINKKETPNSKIKDFLTREMYVFFQIKKYSSLNELENENNNTLISIDLRVNIFKDKNPIFIDYEKKQVKINFQKFNLKSLRKGKYIHFQDVFEK